MSRKIIVCLDGTGNEIESRESNVLRLYKCLKHTDEQIVYYEPGVGTNNTRPFSRRPMAALYRFAGLIAGLGLHHNVLRAYEFICRNYQKDDKLYFFGYSRGAYTARVLAGFINEFGLVAPHELHLIGPVFKAYRKLSDTDERERFAKLRIYQQFFHIEHPGIRFLGLWDTVNSSMRIRPWRGKIVEWGTHASVDVNPSVAAVRHALSLDERRRFYRQQMWTEGQEYRKTRFKVPDYDYPKQDIHQVWFPGTHTDIAGSIQEGEAGLTKIAMHWMKEELDGLGEEDRLEFRPRYYNRYVLGKKDKVTEKMGLKISSPDATAPMHSQMMKGWFVLEFLPRLKRLSDYPAQKGWLPWVYLPLGQPRFVPPGSNIHPSAYERQDKVSGYFPPNLPPNPNIPPQD